MNKNQSAIPNSLDYKAQQAQFTPLFLPSQLNNTQNDKSTEHGKEERSPDQSNIDSSLENNASSENEKQKSHQELENEFIENEKKLTNLSSNINELFKKISSLTQEYQTEICTSPTLKFTKSQLPTYQQKWKSEVNIPHIQASPSKPENFIKLPEFSIKKAESYDDSDVSMKLFEMGKRLGYGKFGDVFECRHKETGCIFALKKIFKSTIQKYQMHDQLLTELSCCARVSHPNIMESYSAFTDQYHIFLVCQFLKGQRLTKKFKSSEDTVKNIIFQVLSAVKYLHSIGITHRDLKPENILIDETGTIKICDFGWANTFDTSSQMMILCGTLDYVCPQMAMSTNYSEKVDLWSIGVLAYQLIYGDAPFKEDDKNSTFQRVKSIDLKFPSEPLTSNECKDFIRRLLKQEQDRMSIEESLSHPFLRQVSIKKCRQFDAQIRQLI